MSKHSEVKEERTAPSRSFFQTFFARPRPIHVLMLLVFVVFGTALVTQVRAQQIDPLETLSEPELIELLSELDSREDALETQRDDLLTQLQDLSSEADQQQVAREAAAKTSLQAEIAAGLIPVKGPGILIGVANPSGTMTAQIFVTTLAELRNAGAEAIELNDVRLTLRTWFAMEDGKIVVDGVPLTAPYTWRVIGDPDTLSSGIEIRGGAASQMRGAIGSTVTIKRYDEVEITSVAEKVNPQWAQVDND